MSSDHCDFGPFLPVGGNFSQDQSTLISNGLVGDCTVVNFSDDHEELSVNVIVDNSSAVVGDSQHLTDSVSCNSVSGTDDFSLTMDSMVNVTSGDLEFVSQNGENNSNAVSQLTSSATFQTDGDHSVLETRDHFGNLKGDVNCEDFIEVISEDVFIADITTAASQYQVSAGVTTKSGVDYGVANSDGTGDDVSGLVLQSASEIGTTQGKVSTGVTGDGNVNLNCSKVSFSAAGNLLIPITINGVSLHAVLDTAAQVSVVGSRFVDNFLPTLKFFGAFTLNGIKADSPLPASRSDDVQVTLGDKIFQWKFLKADISDDCILGLDFIANFKLDIRLSENTVTVGDCVIPIQVSSHNTIHSYTVNTVSLFKNVRIKPYSGINFSLRLHSKFRSDSDFVVLEPISHPSVDILSVMAMKGSDLPITIVNHSDRTVTLSGGFVLGVVSDVVNSNVATPDFRRPEFEIRTLYADEFQDCYPAVKSDNFLKIKQTLPEHLQDLFERSCTNITLYQSVKLANLLSEFAFIFSKSDTDLGHFKAVYHRIVTRNDEPIKSRMRRTPLHFEKEEEASLKKMLDAGVIVESNSEYAHPVCLVRKKDGSVRWCIDMRKLNFYTVKDCFPIPRIEQCLDTLCGNRYFSTLDLLSGYWQIAIHPEDRKKTAFLTKYGLFEHKMMCFGLCNAPATFQRAMQYVLSGLLWEKALCYLDDVISLGTDFESALSNLREIFDRFREHNLKMKPKKCVLFQEQVEYLGRLVSHKGVTLRSEHVQVIRDWPVPTTKQELQSYLGFANYHREYIKNYALLVQPLQQLVNESKSGPIQLDQCHLDVIENIRDKLCNAPIFPYPNPDYTFVLDCDASETAIGCELLQLVDGTEKVIAFGSYSLTPAQRRYCTTRKELLAVIRFTRQFRHYLLGRPFVVRTDHNSLTWLMSFKNIEGQLARWMEELAQFDMSVVHRAGKLHVNADALSRIPDTLDYCVNYKAGVPLSSLPCFSAENPCKFCTRAEEKWSHFERDVDYVVPLSVKQLQVGPELSQGFSNFWVPRYSVGDLRREQLDDLDLGVILRWLESEASPTQCELALKSPEVRHYWLMRDQLVFQDGVLFYKWQDVLESHLLLIVPSSLQDEVLYMNHDTRDSGHLGQLNTYLRVKKSFYWFRLRNCVYNYVSTCAKCKTNKKPHRRRRAGLGQYHAGAPMDRVMIDVLGPLSKTPRGNSIILMLIDQFTKWVECYPLPDQSAELIAKTLVDEFFSRFGLPLEIHTDQGSNFVGNLFTTLCLLLQVTKTRTTSYRPCSNGQIERMNRQLLQMIRCLRERNIKDWDVYLPQIAGAMRATVSRSTGFTANKLMLGREVNKSADLLFGVDKANKISQSPPDYVVRLEKILKEAHRVARENLKSSVLYNKRDYDQPLYQTSYNTGDLVYVLDPSNKPGVSTKLQPIFRGPYLVVKVYSPILYLVQDRKRQVVVHHDRLLLCNDRFIPMWMRKLRHQFLNLDETLPYDEDELQELNMFASGPEEGLQTLFNTESVKEGVADSETEAGTSASTGKDTSVPSPVVIPDSDVGPSSEEAENSESVGEELVQGMTKRGRRIMRPRHLWDYIVGED